jgi:hypothetical protein
MMIRNMPAMKVFRIAVILPVVAPLVLLSSCVEQTGQTQSNYTNPGRSEVYSADERGYEKPWPFGDLANNPQ